jgi:hypothetical protein
MQTGIKKILLGLLLLLLALPAVQAKWHLVAVLPLQGYDQTTTGHPTFSWRRLWAATYQEELESYLTDRLGFREWAIRVRNQVDYSLFGVLHAVDIIRGQHGVLFQQSPLGSYLGQEYLGDEGIRHYTHRLRDVQDSLAYHGVQFLFVLAPGKAGFQPEDLPAKVQATPAGPTNYASLARALPAAGVHVLDASALFKQWKPRAAHPLFPRGGIHWSGYGVTLVADTLFRAVEALTHTDLPDFMARPGVVTTDSLRYTDSDIANALNLVWPHRPYPMAYPIVTFKPPTAQQRRPNALLIGDSFTQSFYGFYPYLPQLLDGRSRFWSYNEYTFWPDNTGSETHKVHDLDLRQQVESRQIVIILATEQNLHKRGFGFVDEVYRLYHPGAPAQ